VWRIGRRARMTAGWRGGCRTFRTCKFPDGKYGIFLQQSLNSHRAQNIVLTYLINSFDILTSTMALNPKFIGQKFIGGSSPQALHTLELYLDYVCPYSKKMFDTIYDSVLPIIKQKYAGKVQVIFRQQIQVNNTMRASTFPSALTQFSLGTPRQP